jgi:hypothetical protein
MYKKSEYQMIKQLLRKPRLDILATALLAMSATGVNAADFDTNFCDTTLRLDYIFSGDATGSVDIALSAKSKFAGWAGRRVNLNKLPVLGRAQVAVTSLDGDTIYINSYSTLFQEWQQTDEAQATRRSYDFTALVPYPNKKVKIGVSLYDNCDRMVAAMSHEIDPSDILIQRKQASPENRYIHRAGDVKEKIDVAILAEGYTDAEKDTFYADAEKAVESILAHSPFKEMADRFNFLAVFTPSKDSGVSIPRFGEWKETAFGSHFSTFYSNRYLTAPNVAPIHDAIAGLPYEHLIILVNTEEYGGGGIYNYYTLTSAHTAKFWPVVTHEFGHSFGALTDEYFYDDDITTYTYDKGVEPWEQNITTMVDFDSKWKDMVTPGAPIPTAVEDAGKYAVGAYEGGGYIKYGVYRPSYNCRMRTNEYPEFCPVCKRAIARIIDFNTVEQK